MNIFGDLTTIVTLVIAVFIFLRLRSVLGKRTGHQRPPFNPRDMRVPLPGDKAKRDGNKVIPLPAGEGETETVNETDAAIAAIAKPGTKLNKQLKEVIAADSSFNPASFLDGAKLAYEMIVTAFADGDKKTLKNLLSREVYDGFASAISERESRSEQVRASFVGIDSAKIIAAELNRSEIQITARFVSQIISATYDSEGKVIEGDPEQVAEVTDIWTFARDARSRDPNWKLVATESEN
ncbi:MAG: Tim44/TimA family putative adaptor protein [Salaquimonas sp.]|jgi:predicted lipid-binding transport protein (Tim44 family)|nr:Tim44/TimA family putative adaptor protein [Salaquimonas sp.]